MMRRGVVEKELMRVALSIQDNKTYTYLYYTIKK